MPIARHLSTSVISTNSLPGSPPVKVDLSFIEPGYPERPRPRAYDPDRDTPLNSSPRFYPYRDGRDPYGGFAVPSVSTFAARYNLHAKAYYYLYDEAQKFGIQTTLAMRRDPFVHELLRHRQLPTASLPFVVEPEDTDDPEQKKTCKEVEQVVRATPRFQVLRMCLLEGVFYGKAGVQLKLGRKRVAGRERVCVVDHVPVNGDKLRFKWDGTAGVQVRDDDGLVRSRYEKYVEPVDISKVLWLYDPSLRERFIIHKFEPSDTDYMFEADQAASVHGLGLRSRLFWAWNMRAELLAWYCDALQRVGANGMLVGFSKTGNAQARIAVENALIQLQKDNWAVFETDAMPGQLKDIIQHIEPSPVGYDNLFQMIVHLEDIMRRAALGQNLSSQSAPTGLGSNVAELQGDMFMGIVRYDAVSLSETLDDQFLPLVLRHNTFAYRGRSYRGDELPFRPCFKLKVDERNVLERMQVAQILAGLGVTLDADQLREIGGFSPPRSPKTTVPMMQPPGAGGPPGTTPDGPPGGPGAQVPAGQIPGLEAQPGQPSFAQAA